MYPKLGVARSSWMHFSQFQTISEAYKSKFSSVNALLARFRLRFGLDTVRFAKNHLSFTHCQSNKLNKVSKKPLQKKDKARHACCRKVSEKTVWRPLVVTRRYCVVMRGNWAVAYPAVVNRLPMGFYCHKKHLVIKNFLAIYVHFCVTGV